MIAESLLSPTTCSLTFTYVALAQVPPCVVNCKSALSASKWE